MIEKITSLQNPLVKDTAELKNKKAREEKGVFFLEGKRAVEEALTCGWQIETLFFTTKEPMNNPALAATKAPCYLVNESIMHKIAATEHPQNIGAVMVQKKSTWNDFPNKDGILLVLDGIMDPGNLGTIIRTADAAGALGIFVLDNSVDLFNPKVIRSTMGSIFHLPIITGITDDQLVDFCEKQGRTLWATALEGAQDYRQGVWPKKVALVMGNEARGVRPELLERTEKKICIPMPGKAESLNVAIATGIFLFAYQGLTCQSK